MSERARRTLLFFGLSGAGLASGCTAEELSVAESDVVVTFRQEGRDYAKYRTYLLPDDVVDLCPLNDGVPVGTGIGGAALGLAAEDLDPERCKAADHSLDEVLIRELRRNLDELGYEEFDATQGEEPDVAFLLGVVAQDNWFVSAAPAFCYPNWYYSGCWYSGISYAYNLPTNSYLIEMVDVSETAEGDLSNVWTAMLQGVAEPSSELSGDARMQRAVHQAFSQSPYLGEGK